MLVFALLPALLTVGAADDGFDRAVTKYQAMDLQGALEGFSELTGEDQDRDTRARAYMWLGITQADMGKFDESEANFVEALVLDPGLELPPDLSPKVQEMFESAQKTAAERPAADQPEDGAAAEDKPATGDDPASADDGGGLTVAPLLLYGGVAVTAGAVLAAVFAMAAWSGAVGLYQGAVAADEAGAALSMYTFAQVFAWTGNGLVGASGLMLAGAGVLGTSWFLLRE